MAASGKLTLTTFLTLDGIMQAPGAPKEDRSGNFQHGGLAGIMAVGAIFGAVNTMYAAVASWAPEIAVLLTLAFRPRSILASFLAESAVIAGIGGVVGCLLALPMNGIVTSTTNWANFSEIAFSFRITSGLLLAGLIFAVVMGMLGGFFPARRASKVPVIQAIR